MPSGMVVRLGLRQTPLISWQDGSSPQSDLEASIFVVVPHGSSTVLLSCPVADIIREDKKYVTMGILKKVKWTERSSILSTNYNVETTFPN